MRDLLWSTLIPSALVLAVQATFYNDPSAVANKAYDFIVVGGGAAGAVVASRLSEVTSFKVLLVEAGPLDLDYHNIFVPLNASLLTPSILNWNYSYIPTPYVDNRAVPVARGHVLGGSTSINYLVQNKGSVEFWDQLADLSGDFSYSSANMSNYLLKYEAWTHPMDGHDESREYVATAHNTTGPVKITTYNYKWDVHTNVISAAGQVPGWEYNQDSNAGNMLGLSVIQGNEGTGIRYSSALSYIHANGVSSRENLHILLSTTATRLVLDDSTTPQVTGVEFAAGPTTRKHVATAKKEVILSAGAFNTPALLQLSGIGDPNHLSSLGIQTRVARPDVGKNLQDHPNFSIYYSVNTTHTTDAIFRGERVSSISNELWFKNHSGPMGDTVASTYAFGRAPLDGDYDPSPGGNSPIWEMVYGNGYIGPTPATGNYMTATGIFLTPKARGTVLINSTSPFALPIVDGQYLDNTWDISTMRYVFKKAREFIENAPAMNGFILGRYGHQIGVETDDEIDAFVRQTVSTTWHPTSTAAMSKFGTDDGVVDPAFKVKGLANLRIVDASIFPRVTSGHPTGMLYALSEKASDIIKAAYHCQKS